MTEYIMTEKLKRCIQNISPDLNETCVFAVTSHHHSMYLCFDACFLFLVTGLYIPLAQPCLPNPVLKEEEANLNRVTNMLMN
jgi:hypothetical protein